MRPLTTLVDDPPDPPGLLLSAGAVAAREHAVAVVMQLVLDAMHDGGHVGHRDRGNQDAYTRRLCSVLTGAGPLTNVPRDGTASVRPRRWSAASAWRMVLG